MGAATAIDIDNLCRTLDIGWDERDVQILQDQIKPYSDALAEYARSGRPIPTHIPGSASVCVPITSVTDPVQLYREADGAVSHESFQMEEFPNFHVTVHFSTVPVVILLLKENRSNVPKIRELCERSSKLVGEGVGGDTGVYLQWNQPKFAWTLHTDDDYEGVKSRLHVPLVTTPENLFAWADRLDAPFDDWIRVEHLTRGNVYQVRTDIPHTAINRNPREARLHLLVDVGSQRA